MFSHTKEPSYPVKIHLVKNISPTFYSCSFFVKSITEIVLIEYPIKLGILIIILFILIYNKYSFNHINNELHHNLIQQN